jgi:hypothetical protein
MSPDGIIGIPVALLETFLGRKTADGMAWEDFIVRGDDGCEQQALPDLVVLRSGLKETDECHDWYTLHMTTQRNRGYRANVPYEVLANLIFHFPAHNFRREHILLIPDQMILIRRRLYCAQPKRKKLPRAEIVSVLIWIL